jgi:hypothetical protein
MSVTLNPMAACNSEESEGCTWSQPHSEFSRDAAKRHAKETGHPVIVETITRDLYRLED